MQRFFIKDSSFDNDKIVIAGENARHISYSLRMKPGEEIVLCDGNSNECLCEIESITSDNVNVLVKQRMKSEGEPCYRAVLFQALAKGEKMDYIIQKAVEFGVYKIIPFESNRTVVKLRGKDTEKKVARWNKISEEAAKQCGRGIIPVVCEPMDFDTALKTASGFAGVKFVCYESEEDKSIVGLDKSSDYSFFVGSEGGFEKSEIDSLKEAGYESLSLGKRILRCESASGFVLSCLSYINDLG